MKLSQVTPVRWWRQLNRWAMGLSPWRYSALMASGIASGTAAGAGLGGAGLAEVVLLGGTNWLILFLVGRLIAPAALQGMRLQQQWREQRRQQRQEAQPRP